MGRKMSHRRGRGSSDPHLINQSCCPGNRGRVTFQALVSWLDSLEQARVSPVWWKLSGSGSSESQCPPSAECGRDMKSMGLIFIRTQGVLCLPSHVPRENVHPGPGQDVKVPLPDDHGFPARPSQTSSDPLVQSDRPRSPLLGWLTDPSKYTSAIKFVIFPSEMALLHHLCLGG